ncbi:MAG TPA: FHA domain-containing protein [Vicinamibacteria bacterium]
MRFELRLPSAPVRELELQGTTAVAGRDPFCDLVLDDPKCSRRHAVFEAGPRGVLIRDNGSANGVYVNGKRVQQAGLSEGDVVRLGDTLLKVLPEHVPGTLIMTPGEVKAIGASPDSLPTPASPPPRAPGLADSAPAFRTGVMERPVVRRPGAYGARPRAAPITALAGLWVALAGSLLVAAGYFALSPTRTGLERAAGSITSLALAGVAAALAFGLWTRAPWARTLQLAAAGVGLLVCPFSLAAATVLLYMTRPSARAQFDRSPVKPSEPASDERAAAQANVAFTAALLGTALLGIALAVMALLIPRLLLARSGATRLTARESGVVRRMQALGASEAAFRSGTCEGYGDLDALVNPGSVIPNYPAGGPSFLPLELAAPEALGYRFQLQLEDPAPPGEGCPSRSYRRYTLTASPLDGTGRHFVMRSDRVIHTAEGRPATLADTALK